MPRSSSVLSIAVLLAAVLGSPPASAGPQAAPEPAPAAAETPAPAQEPPAAQPSAGSEQPAAPGEAPAGEPASGEAPVVAPVAPDAPAETPLEPGDIRVKADAYSQQEKGHMEASGTVELRVADMKILADKADVFETPQPDGTVKRRVVAVGNVVFMRGEERLAGDRAEMDDMGHGFFENAVGYVEPGVFIEARRVERVDADTYKVQGARFTACAQPNPRWKFSAARARIEINDKIVASSAILRVKGVPALYLPWFYYPIQQDGRSTGFLMPHFGHSSYRGWTAGTGFFWAMGRSLDQTFYADSWSKLGFGLGHELRYDLPTPSRGRFRTYFFDMKDPGTVDANGQPVKAENEYDLDWNAVQMLPGKTRVSLVARRTSNLFFRSRFEQNFALATSRSNRFVLSADRDLGFATLNAYADASSTAYGAEFKNVSERVPGISLRRYPKQIGAAGLVFGLQASADAIRYGNQALVDEWTRIDVAPTLSRPLQLSFLEITPSAGYRFTRYGKTIATETTEDGDRAAIIGPPKNRTFFEGNLELRGPIFARVFDTPGSFYSERFKHTIGPEVTWQYRTRVDEANTIPKFGGEDYSFGTNQVMYALVQRFYAKRPGVSGKAVPYSFFEWRLGQTYYVKITEGGNAVNAYDPNYSSSAYGPGGQPQHLSPLQSRMRLRPGPDYSLDYNVEYDVNFGQLRRMTLGGNVSAPRVNLRANWSRSLRLSEDPAKREVSSHTLRGETVLDVWPRRLTLEGSVDYDLRYDTLYQMRGRMRYAIQCCGFSVDYTTYDWNGTTDSTWSFSIELAGMNALGGFLGSDARGNAGLGAYR